MAYRFTSEDAFNASSDGEPIGLGRRDLERLCDDHSAAIDDMLADLGLVDSFAPEVDAAAALLWLGY